MAFAERLRQATSTWCMPHPPAPCPPRRASLRRESLAPSGLMYCTEAPSSSPWLQGERALAPGGSSSGRRRTTAGPPASPAVAPRRARRTPRRRTSERSRRPPPTTRGPSSSRPRASSSSPDAVFTTPSRRRSASPQPATSPAMRRRRASRAARGQRRRATRGASRMRSSRAPTTPCCRSATCSTTAARRASSRTPTIRPGAGSKAITHPAVGNHEYGNSDAAPYFKYFGAAAGDPAKGWYCYDLGAWHLIALNSNCSRSAAAAPARPRSCGCAPTSPRIRRCTLAYWHHPRFTSGQHGNDTACSAIWSDLYVAGAELVLNGHDHDYERFAPQTATACATTPPASGSSSSAPAA